ncbi:MAG: hypothetical protein ACI9VN_000740, partial [Patescibacteria group bacterium]
TEGGKTIITQEGGTSFESIQVNTDPIFTGVLTADRNTGLVSVTNAKPAGIYEITITGFGNGLSYSTTMTLTVTEGSVCNTPFAVANVAVGEEPYTLAIGDFNEDGNQDIATANRNSNNVSIRLGDGAGGFNGATQVPVGEEPYDMLVRDFDGDGHQDIITSNPASSNILVLHGDGLGGFSGGGAQSIGIIPYALTAGNYNNIGLTDIVVSVSDQNFVRVFPDGDFGSSELKAVGNKASFISTGDFDEDGIGDVVTIDKEENNVSIYLGAATESVEFPIGLGAEPSALVIGDFNEDGHQDIATANGASNNVSILLGDGTGSFSASSEIPIANGGEPFSLVLGDSNNDGYQDITTSNRITNTISTLLGDGTGNFSEGLQRSVGDTPSHIVAGDFNNDGKQDIAVTNTSTNGEVYIFLGTSSSIQVFGNDLLISDGDISPSVSDGTDFENFVLLGSVERTFTLKNTSSTDLLLEEGMINVIGTDAAMFSVGSLTFPATVSPNDEITFTVDFIPTSVGLKTATLDIDFHDCEDYDFSLQGIGVEPEAGIYPNTTIVAGADGTITATGGTSFNSMIATTDPNFKGVFTVGGSSGEILLTNAHPAGTYSVKVVGFTAPALGLANDCDFIEMAAVISESVSTTFELTVTDPSCSQSLFIPTDDVPISGEGPTSIVIGDFNFDGVQDIITTHSTDDFPDIDLSGFPDIDLPNLNRASTRWGLGDGTFTSGNAPEFSELIVGYDPRSITTGDFNGDGFLDIAVANSDFVGNVFVRLGFPGGFLPPEIEGQLLFNNGGGDGPYGPYSRQVVTGDFNNDDKLDLAIVSTGIWPYSGPVKSTVTIQMGDGQGAFSERFTPTLIDPLGTMSKIKVGDASVGLVVGDFNEDGFQDVAAASSKDNLVSIRFGDDGFCRFNDGQDVGVGDNPSALVMGDFDNDGHQDLAVTNTDDNTVSIRLGGGNGIFGVPVGPVLTVGEAPSYIALGDFNGDGNQDLVVTNEGSHNITILTGNGDGSFSLAETIPVGNSPRFVAVGDFNDDNYQDIAVANHGSQHVSILLGREPMLAELDIQGNGISIPNGSNTPSVTNFTDFGYVGTNSNFLRTFTIENIGTTPFTLDAAAITVEGPDASLFTIGDNTSNTRVEIGESTTFTIDFAPGSVGLKTATVRLTDVVCGETLNYVFVVQGNGTTPPTLGIYPNTTIIAAANTTIIPDEAPTNTTSIVAYTDTNFTGILDVDPTTGELRITNAYQTGVYTVTVKAFIYNSVSSTTSFTLTVLDSGCSTGEFETDNIAGSGTRMVAIGDFNEDGHQDIAAIRTGNIVSIEIGDGSAGFTGGTNVAVGANPRYLAIGDVNGDGHQDLLVTNSLGDNVSIRLGDGMGDFSGNTDIPIGGAPYKIELGDFDEDGNLDFVTTDFDHKVSIRLGDGNGNFVSGSFTNDYTNVNVLSVGDFNEDGHQDIVLAEFNGGTDYVKIRFGNGDGTFPLSQQSTVFSNSNGVNFYDIIISDFNEDGHQDIAFSYLLLSEAKFSIFLGNGDGSFAMNQDLAYSSGAYSIITGDFNEDGHQDLALDGLGNDLAIFTGDGTGTFNEYTSLYLPTIGDLAVGDFNEDGLQDIIAANFSFSSSGGISMALAIPNYRVLGNNLVIRNNDNSPSVNDQTDFGDVCTSEIQNQTFTIKNTGGSPLTLNSGAISLSGSDAAMFAIAGIVLPTTIDVGASKGFSILFEPSSEGMKTASVHIELDECPQYVHEFTIQGNGVDFSIFELGDYEDVTVFASANISISPNTPPSNIPGLVAFTNTDFTGIFNVDPVTGIVTITNAKQTGIHTITVKAIEACVPSTTFTLTVLENNCSVGSFTKEEGTGIEFDKGVREVVIGDFNNDGNQDAALDYLTSDTITILIGNGDGTFYIGPKLELATIISKSLAVGDFNGDGNQDLVFLSANHLNLHLGNGDGTFGSGSSWDIPGMVTIAAYELGVGDFDGDGFLDVAVGSSFDASVTVFLNDGMGEFIVGGTSLATTNGESIRDMVVGDFNEDNQQDLAVIVEIDFSISKLIILTGDGFGNFNTHAEYTNGFNPYGLAIGDFDNDGFQDLAVANNEIAGSVSIYLGEGTGLFVESNGVSVFNQPREIAIGDFNGDGDQDIATASGCLICEVGGPFSNIGKVSVRYGDGSGGFTGNLDIPLDGFCYDIAVGDLDNDSSQDLIPAIAAINVHSPINASPFHSVWLGESELPVITVPANVTIECYENTDPQNTGTATATTSNNPQPTISFMDVSTQGNQGCEQNVYMITRTWTAISSCGNQISEDQLINVENNTVPIITCPGPIEAIEGCEETAITIATASFAYSAIPVTIPVAQFPGTVNLSCGATTATYIDLITDNSCPNPILSVTRSWTVTDDCGNTSSTCIQVITVEDNTAPLITCSGQIGPIEGCDENAITVATTGFVYSATAVTIPVAQFTGSVDEEACGAATATYIDLITDSSCPNPILSVTRSWTVTDNCGNTSSTCTQVITIEDNTAPLITCPAAIDPIEGCDENAITVASSGFAYSATAVTIPVAQFPGSIDEEACGAATATYIDLITDSSCPNPILSVTRSWTVTDNCGNTSSTCTQVITIEDNTAPLITCPAAIGPIEGCDENAITVSTVGFVFSATAVTIPVAQFPGSVDEEACGAATATYIDLITDNSCPNPILSVTRSWTVTDNCGNTSSTCTQVITVEDNTLPAMTCAANITIECDQSTAPANTGTTTAIDACDPLPAINFTDVSTQGTIGCSQYQYTITRTWTAIDNCGNVNTCYQIITVVDTTSPVIASPSDQTLTCFENVPEPLNTPADFVAAGGTIDDNCTASLSEFTVFSQNDDNGGNNCPGDARILTRTYFVKDACGNTTSSEQTFTYLESTQAPVITSILPSCHKYCGSLANPMETDISYTTDCSFGATVSISGPVIIGPENCPGSIHRYTYLVTDDCNRTSAPVTRDFIIGNNGPTIECAPFNLILECGNPNNSDYIDAHLDEVTVNTSCELGYTINHFPQNFNNIACGTATVVTFVATDACGRTATCTTTIAVQDNNLPTITSVYENGICNEAICGSDVNFWFNEWKAKVLEGLSATDDCDTNVSITVSGPSSPVQDCPDGTAETVLTWVATDNCENTTGISYSFYVVPVNDPTPSPNVMGMIATEETETVEGVAVTLAGSNGINLVDVTEADGMYEFNNLVEGQNYSVTPMLDENPLNGVSSYDLVLITKHILQLQLLDSPYKMIAADINNSGSITTMDIVELRKLILHIDEVFASNTSWRFVETAYIFPEPTNPFATIFPEEVYINGLITEELHNFVGVKIGDVNGSAIANLEAGAEDRNFVGDLVFGVEDRQLKGGETYDLAFSANNFEVIHGYQFSLNFDKNVLAFKNVKAGALAKMNESSFGLSLLDEGIITTSWTNQVAQSLARNAEVFTVTFTAKADVLLSDVISISSRYTKAEAYNADLDLMDVQLRFKEGGSITNKLRLYQNVPNPFAQTTLIGFELPEASAVVLNVYGLSGHLIKRIEGDFAKGYNSVSLSDEGLASGLLYYELVTPMGAERRKMIHQKR